MGLNANKTLTLFPFVKLRLGLRRATLVLGGRNLNYTIPLWKRNKSPTSGTSAELCLMTDAEKDPQGAAVELVLRLPRKQEFIQLLSTTTPQVLLIAREILSATKQEIPTWVQALGREGVELIDSELMIRQMEQEAK